MVQAVTYFATNAAGEVDLKVTHKGPVSVDKNIRNVNLDQGKTTRVTVNFDDILGLCGSRLRLVTRTSRFRQKQQRKAVSISCS